MKLLHSKTFLLQTFSIFTFFSLMQATTWLPLRYWSAWGGGNFLDSWQVLKYSECFQIIGLRIYGNDVDSCSNYLYGRSLVFLLESLNLGISLTKVFGYIFLFLLALTISAVYKVETKRDFIVLSLVVCSPPVLLLADRGNFDILIIFLLLLSSRSFKSHHDMLALVLIFVCSIFKFYSIPLLLVFVCVGRSSKIKMFAGTLFMIASYMAAIDIAITKAEYPHGASGQFGMNVWGEYLNTYNLTTGSNIRNYILCTIIFSIIAFFGKPFLIFLLPSSRQNFEFNGFIRDFTSPGSLYMLVFISCYLVGMNFDYRLVVFLLAILYEMKNSREASRNFLTVVLLSIIWISFPSGGLQPVGDLILEVAVGLVIRNLVFHFVAKKNKLKIRPAT